MPTPLGAAPAITLLPLLALALDAQSPVDDARLREWLTSKDVPAAGELAPLLEAAVARLSSPDPAVRDDLAFSLLARWIFRDGIVPAPQCRGLAATLVVKLRAGIGAPANDTVAGRSFAALTLSLLAARDLDAPFLDADAFADLVTAALRYLHDEQDVRGLDAELGWLHSVAHTADLLKFLARNPQLTKAQQRAILDAIADKVAAVSTPLTCGEDERLARAVLSLAARDDFDRDGFGVWLPGWCGRRFDGEPLVELARRENRKHVLVSLFTLLSLDRRVNPSLDAARAALRAALGG